MGCASSSASGPHRNVIPVSPQNGTQPNLTDKSLCLKHGGKALIKYSEKNNKLYCDLCISGTRNSATQVKDITNYVQSIQFKQKRIKTENEIRSKKREVQSLLSDVKDNITALDAQKNNLTEEINNFKSAVIDIINYLCDGLCDRVMLIYDQEKKALDKRNKDLLEYLQNLTPKECNDTMVQNPDALKLLNMIEMEKVLSKLSSPGYNTYVDVQLKLHDNIPLRKLLLCDKTASTLGEIAVLRNIKTERPCTKDLIVHDISDVDEANETDDTLSEKSGEDIEDKQATTIATKRASSLSRTLNMETNRNEKSVAEIQNKSKDDPDKRNIMRRKPEKLSENNVDSKAPIRSVTPRMDQKSRMARDSKSRNVMDIDRESISRISQSVKSNFSIMTPSSIQFGTPINEKKFFERSAVLVKNISLPVDDKESDVSSSVILPNGSVILCDRGNRKLRYFDHTFCHISDFVVDYEPSNICPLNDTALSSDMSDTRVAVSFPKSRLIQIVNVTLDSLAKVDEIRTEPECWGIGCKGKSLVFSTERGDVFRDVGDYRNYRWRKYRYSFQKPVSLTVDNASIYVCNWGLREVSGSLVAMYFDDRGKNQIKFSYSNRFLRRPISCSLDSEENIYICEAESKGIHQVSSDGSQFRILDVKGGQTGSWQHINFVPDSDYFVLTEAGSNILYIFQMR